MHESINNAPQEHADNEIFGFVESNSFSLTGKHGRVKTSGTKAILAVRPYYFLNQVRASRSGGLVLMLMNRSRVFTRMRTVDHMAIQFHFFKRDPTSSGDAGAAS